MALLIRQKKNEKVNIHWLRNGKTEQLGHLEIVALRWKLDKRKMLESSVKLDFFTYIDNEHHYYWLKEGMHLEILNNFTLFLCTEECKKSHSYFKIMIGYQASKYYNIARADIDRFADKK